MSIRLDVSTIDITPSRATSCTGKVRYGSEAKALRGTFALFIKKGEMTHPYRCDYCRRWHNGHVIGTKEGLKIGPLQS